MRHDPDMKISSKAFAEGAAIPSKYTCDGANVSPPLGWEQVPEKAASLMLIVHDPDAPAGDWVHWVVYNLPPVPAELPEGVPASETLTNRTLQGRSDFRKIGYGGPCPPGGTHRYYFRLYALDRMLELPAGATRAQVEKAGRPHVLAEAALMGTYARRK
jgi:Raf kinase inhibitor-like YbhB/YbcL family protein